jgi:hypothetical protein
LAAPLRQNMLLCFDKAHFTNLSPGGARRPATSDRMSANICRGTATLGHLERDVATFAPILISFSRRLVSDHGSAVFGIASVRVKLPRL